MTPFFATRRCAISILIADLIILMSFVLLLIILRSKTGSSDEGDPSNSLSAIAIFIVPVVLSLVPSFIVVFPATYLLALPGIWLFTQIGAALKLTHLGFYLIAGFLVGISVYILGGVILFNGRGGFFGVSSDAPGYFSFFQIAAADQIVKFSIPFQIAGFMSGYYAWASGRSSSLP